MRAEGRRGRAANIGLVILTFVGNCVIYLVAFAVGLRVIYPLVFSALGMGLVAPGVSPVVTETQAITTSVGAAFFVFGAVSRVWTRHFVNVFVPSALMFISGMILIAEAMYLADHGDPAIMWRYIQPDTAVYLGSFLVGGGAVIGWYAGTYVRNRLGRPAVA